jgi:ubiquitin-protein ligase
MVWGWVLMPPWSIVQELRDWLANPIENLNVAVGDNIRVWVVTLTGAKGTIYAGEKYKLKVRGATLQSEWVYRSI